MRKQLVPILLILLLFASFTTVSAQKTTIDPNTISKVDTDKPDARLEQKVTYEAKNKCVSAILADLSKASGVTLKAGINEKDWQVRDRKMNIFAKDTPLKDLMDSIARVMKFMWASGKKDGERTYRLFMDRKTLLDIESKAMREQERKEKDIADKRVKALNEFASQDTFTQEELAQMKKDKPLKYLAVASGISAGLGAFFQDAPMALEALATGKQMAFNGSSLSHSAQAGLARALKGIDRLVGTNLPDDILTSIGSAKVKIAQNQNMGLVDGLASTTLGSIGVQIGNEVYNIPMPDPDSEAWGAIGKMMVKGLDEGMLPGQLFESAEYQNAMFQGIVSDRKASNPAEEAPRRPDDPALLVKIKPQLKSQYLVDAEKTLQEATGFAVVSDSFGKARGIGAIPKDEITIKDALDKIGDAFLYNWDKHAGVIELRDRKWYSKRAAQIPEAWLEDWKKTLRETGTLDLDDLSEIVSLSMDQIQQNILPDPDLARSGVANCIYTNRELPKLYASLSDAQRKQMFSTNGLDLSTLSDNQWQIAAALITRSNAEQLQTPNLRMVIMATKTAVGKHYNYTFKLTSSENTEALSWNLQTPEYKEPPKGTPEGK